MSEQAIYLKMKPIAMMFGTPIDPWEESVGACVDDVNFEVPDSQHRLTLPGNDKFIGRTACA